MIIMIKIISRTYIYIYLSKIIDRIRLYNIDFNKKLSYIHFDV